MGLGRGPNSMAPRSTPGREVRSEIKAGWNQEMHLKNQVIPCEPCDTKEWRDLEEEWMDLGEAEPILHK